jgi:RimJ/RimL family protein N-acetyltransferase
MKSDPQIVPLIPADATRIAAMLQAASPQYAAHFRPFAFDEATVRAQLERAQKDRFWGIKTIAGELAGFYMLRGFDEGYERPSFGVFIAEQFAGRGLARQALDAATQWCEEHGVREMMLTVFPENSAARRVYEEAGFAVAESRPERIVMTKRLAR